MKSHVVEIDRSKSLAQESSSGHNRWHEDIPPILKIDPGDEVVLQTRDALDGQLTPRSTLEDVARIDRPQCPGLGGAAAGHLHALTRSIPDVRR